MEDSRVEAARPLKVFIIEGAIAAGKSTLVAHLEKVLTNRGLIVAIAPEPVEEWERVGILGAFYRDPTLAYSFQTFTCMTRIRSMCAGFEAAIKKHGRVDVVLAERSPLTDRYVFMELQSDIVGPMHMEMYKIWWEEWMRLVPGPVVEALKEGRWYEIWLNPSIENCMKRLRNRGRSSEAPDGAEGVSTSYQKRLVSAHKEFLLSADSPVKTANVIEISGEGANCDFREGAEVAVSSILRGAGVE